MNITKTDKFNIDNAITFVKYSNLAYEDMENVKRTLPGEVRFFDKNDTQCIVHNMDDAVVFAFRGTESFQDVLVDINFIKCDWYGHEVHQGFFGALQEVYEDLFAIADECDDKDIYITGHSLGGALASLFAARLEIEEGIDFEACYTFGSPRVFGESAAKAVNDSMKHKLFRVVNQSDIVPSVPPELLGFSHCGTFTYVEADEHIHVGEMEWWNILKEKVEDQLEDGHDDNLTDHFVGSYIENLLVAKQKEL